MGKCVVVARAAGRASREQGEGGSAQARKGGHAEDHEDHALWLSVSKPATMRLYVRLSTRDEGRVRV